MLMLVISLTGLFCCFSSANPCALEQPAVVNETEGLISSPGYGEESFNSENVSCSWLIIAEPNKVIHIEFLHFQLPYSFNCVFDGLLVFDGKATESSVLVQACDQSLPKNVTSTGPFLLLIYHRERISKRGRFTLRFKQINPKEPCREDQLTCRNHNCVNRTLICNGIDDCGDGTDEEECRYKRQKLICGRPNIIPELVDDRIVGGTKAVPGGWPWQVSLRFPSAEPYGHVCGGSLINEQWILTAAHCFRDNQKEVWTAHLGKYYKFKRDHTEQLRYIKKLFIHPKYLEMMRKERSDRKDNDIALIQLNAPVNVSGVVQPICLSKFSVSTGTRAYVTGWGDTLGTGYSDVLKQAAVQIISYRKCKKAYYNIFPVRTTMICAGHMSGGEDSCKGDSGGPLVIQRKGTWYLAGIVSSGGKCGEAGKPGVYTRVSKYTNWIKTTLRNYH